MIYHKSYPNIVKPLIYYYAKWNDRLKLIFGSNNNNRILIESLIDLLIDLLYYIILYYTILDPIFITSIFAQVLQFMINGNDIIII